MVSVERFVEGLCAIEERAFTVPNVARYMNETPVEPSSLAAYLDYRPTHYTRNLIYKCDLFELLAICWNIGQTSRIHNHHNQHCWMAAPIGRLVVQNYQVAHLDESRNSCKLVPADRLVMDGTHPSFVHPDQPIHAVLNPPEFGARATSLHVYSRPYDRCLVYSLEKDTYSDVPLFYDSEYGRRTGSDGQSG